MNRLSKYDYSQTGYYFVTICLQNRIHLFGEIFNGKMILNDAGEMINRIWSEIPEFYLGININEYVIMPDHLHGIINIQNPIGSTHVNNPVGTDPRVCPNDKTICPNDKFLNTGQSHQPNTGQSHQPNTGQSQQSNLGQSRGIVPTIIDTNTETPTGLSVSTVIQRFKSLTTRKYIDGVNQNGWPPFERQLWQRSFHDRIMRNNDELNRIQKYIIENPLKWVKDKPHDH